MTWAVTSFTVRLRCRNPGIHCCLYCADLAAHEDRDAAAADLLLRDQPDVGHLAHRTASMEATSPRVSTIPSASSVRVSEPFTFFSSCMSPSRCRPSPAEFALPRRCRLEHRSNTRAAESHGPARADRALARRAARQLCRIEHEAAFGAAGDGRPGRTPLEIRATTSPALRPAGCATTSTRVPQQKRRWRITAGASRPSTVNIRPISLTPQRSALAAFSAALCSATLPPG